MFLEPLKLSSLNRHYKLSNIKEFKVTDSFMTLDEEIRNCQEKESYDDCATKNYIETVKQQLDCLPLAVRLSDEVINDDMQNESCLTLLNIFVVGPTLFT